MTAGVPGSGRPLLYLRDPKRTGTCYCHKNPKKIAESQGFFQKMSKKFIPRAESSEIKSSSEVCQSSSFLGI